MARKITHQPETPSPLPWRRCGAGTPAALVRWLVVWGSLALVAGLLSGCVRSTNPSADFWRPGREVLTAEPGATSIANPFLPQPRGANDPIYTPTPDPPHSIPGVRVNEEQYIVQPGDTLSQIAMRFGVPVGAIAAANEINNINVLEVGQVLVIPAPQLTDMAPGFKIIPDSELVASPVTAYFNVPEFVYRQNGYLVRHQEEVEGQMLSGFQIVQRVAQDYSLNPRVLLALLEYQSGWVTDPNPRTKTLTYPLGLSDAWREGLYKQLAWAADQLNYGYYAWRANGVSSWVLADGRVVPVNPTINAGTAALQYTFAQLYGHELWERTITEEGFSAVYNSLFGYPFDYSFEPLVPGDLTQPPMQLPFEEGVVWAFTGGPHGGWGDGSAWAALDFAPFTEKRGCYSSEEWVVAMADGLIVRAENGAVVQDLDNDGREQTGWTILYMHVESRDRVASGTYLKAGERIGHPSCEGGISNGTHVHIARRYNGEWIPADGGFPFIMDGWVSSGAGNVYDGYLEKGSVVIEAYNGSVPENAIQR